jgi:hypothetical protein
MEEYILQIINNKFYDYNHKIGKIGSTGQFKMQTAREITSHVMEFILWLSLNAHIATSYSLMFYLYSGNGEDRHIDFTKEHHIDYIYNLWLENIKLPSE